MGFGWRKNVPIWKRLFGMCIAMPRIYELFSCMALLMYPLCPFLLEVFFGVHPFYLSMCVFT